MIIMTAFTVFVVFRLTPGLSFVKRLWSKVVADYVITFSVVFGIYGIFFLIYSMIRLIDGDITGLLLFYVVTFLVVEMLYYIKHSREALRNAEAAKREALQYQYDALKAHVNPHFLFNSLNVLLAIIDTDTKKAGEFTIALSRIYRYILATQNQKSVPISEEMSFLDSYVHIMKMKYYDSFNLNVSGDGDRENNKIVPFTLQLLVENITKHNTISDKYPMEVSICINDDYMTVTNKIKRKKSTSQMGIGLKYLSSQYQVNGGVFEVEDDGKHFTAKIPFL